MKKVNLKKLIDKNKYYLITGICSIVIVIALYILNEVAPFGENSMLTVDFYHQYGPLLKELYDVDTIETHGLGLDDKTLELIKEASKTRGVIVLTDPDYPGLRIRNQVEKYVQNCKHAFVDRKDAIGRKKLGIAEANKEAVKKAIENVVTFSNQEESISWKEFLELDIIGDKKKRLKIYDLFHLGYGNAKTLFKRLNMVGISREMIEKELENEGYSD